MELMTVKYSEVADEAIDQVVEKNYDRFRRAKSGDQNIFIVLVADGYKRHFAWSKIKADGRDETFML